MPRVVYPNITNIPPSRKGIPHTEETKRKMSLSKKGWIPPHWLNRIWAEEVKKKISKANRGKTSWNKGKIGIYSEEYRKKISAGLKGKRKPPRLEEHRKNLSKALKGHEVSEEIRKKISQAQIGREISEETRRKLSKAKKGSKHPLWGKRHTAEAKNKMRNTKINQYRNNSELIIRISNSVKKLWRDPEYRKKHTGPNHHWWKGGITKREETLAHALRVELRNWAKEVLERDNYTCQRCSIRSEEKRVMQVHHIKSVLEYPSLVLDIANGITLCEDCHRKTESYGRKFRKQIVGTSNVVRRH